MGYYLKSKNEMRYYLNNKDEVSYCTNLMDENDIFPLSLSLHRHKYIYVKKIWLKCGIQIWAIEFEYDSPLYLFYFKNLHVIGSIMCKF